MPARAGVSYAQTQSITCSSCHRAFDFTVWLIVDTAERPDLLARIRKGTLHDVTCPHCRADLGRIEAPLLVYTPSSAEKGRHGRPSASPHAQKSRGGELLFSPPRGTPVKRHREHAAELLHVLRMRPGIVWRKEWERNLSVVPRELLPIALATNPEAALQEFLTELRTIVGRLRQEDPVAYTLLEEDAHKAVTELLTADPISAAILALLQADSVPALLRVARDYPVILTPEAEARITAGLDRTRHTETEALTQSVGKRYRLLLQLYQAARERGLSVDEAIQMTAEREAQRPPSGDVGRGQPPSDVVQRIALVKALYDFLVAPTWPDSRRVLEDHPDLLGEEADSLFRQLADGMRSRGNEGFAALVEEHRTLLRRCREVGIPQAFAEKPSQSKAPGMPSPS
ncbi:MAG: CpXC domain-containing protein [Caldilineales bacterium]|nr:CpXC domain-containing protein [Caldilineales bacterium]